MLAHTFNQEAEMGGSLWVHQAQPRLHRELLDSHTYIVKPFLKKKKNPYILYTYKYYILNILIFHIINKASH